MRVGGFSFKKLSSLDIRGTIKFTNDTTYWQANSFKYACKCLLLLSLL